MKRLPVLLALCLLTACSAQSEKASPVPPFDYAPDSAEATPGRQGDIAVSSLSSVSFISSTSSSFSSSYPLHPTPYTLHLSVPFSPQAPLADWDALHEESCEEMSLILVHHFLAGTDINREQAETELLALTAWETEHGYPQDVTVQELGKIAEEYFGYHARVIEDPATEDLKRLLADGHPVIVPAAGRDLGNPYFSGEGPWYHMLVLTGYNEFFFQTNDVGTRRGEGYVYRFETLLNAIHDWTGVKEEIRNGPKRVLIIEKQ
ncbi:MAG: C39 family peptidase [Candidatus Peribacteraceae bacterium]|nr:C39 family peptidase [Candidatus Peribacteraceae bacterium]MDD5739447.1 C39 family peptidase [Candidatus Peribacteraceae bacterium]